MRWLTLRNWSVVPLAMFSFYAPVENHEKFLKTTLVLADGQNRAAFHLIISILFLHFSQAKLGWKPSLHSFWQMGPKALLFSSSNSCNEIDQLVWMLYWWKIDKYCRFCYPRRALPGQVSCPTCYSCQRCHLCLCWDRCHCCYRCYRCLHSHCCHQALMIRVIRVIRITSVRSLIGILTHQGHIKKVNDNADSLTLFTSRASYDAKKVGKNKLRSINKIHNQKEFKNRIRDPVKSQVDPPFQPFYLRIFWTFSSFSFAHLRWLES